MFRKKNKNYIGNMLRGHSAPQDLRSSFPRTPGRLGMYTQTKVIVVLSLFHAKQKHTLTMRAGTAGGSKRSEWPLCTLFCPNRHRLHRQVERCWSHVKVEWVRTTWGRASENREESCELPTTNARAPQPLRQADGRASLPAQAGECSREMYETTRSRSQSGWMDGIQRLV